MKKFLFTMMLMIGSLTMVVADAEAGRMGGGRSIGRQSSNVSRQAAPATPSQVKPAAPAAAGSPATAATPPKPASPWKGIVGGLVGGALLGAMFSSMGMGGGLASALGSILPMLLLAGVAFFLFRLFQNRKSGPVPASAYGSQSYDGANANALPEIGSRIEPMAYQAGQSATASGFANQASWNIPDDFDVAGFLRNSKTYFIRLQAAWDKADINDIREFTSPEMYAEIKLQIQERGPSPNVTDVVSIEAELLGLEVQGNDHLASVQFSGMIKEEPNAPAEAFKEVWNLAKPVRGQGGWILAGIQQL